MIYTAPCQMLQSCLSVSAILHLVFLDDTESATPDTIFQDVLRALLSNE